MLRNCSWPTFTIAICLLPPYVQVMGGRSNGCKMVERGYFIFDGRWLNEEGGGGLT